MDCHHIVHLSCLLSGKLDFLMYENRTCFSYAQCLKMRLRAHAMCLSLSQIPLFGIMSSDSADPFYWMRVILASNRGKSVSVRGILRCYGNLNFFHT